MGNIGIGREVLSKGKKQYLHPGKSKVVHDFLDIRSNDPQIFGNHRQVGEFLDQVG